MASQGFKTVLSSSSLPRPRPVRSLSFFQSIVNNKGSNFLQFGEREVQDAGTFPAIACSSSRGTFFGNVAFSIPATGLCVELEERTRGTSSRAPLIRITRGFRILSESFTSSRITESGSQTDPGDTGAKGIGTPSFGQFKEPVPAIVCSSLLTRLNCG